MLTAIVYNFKNCIIDKVTFLKFWINLQTTSSWIKLLTIYQIVMFLNNCMWYKIFDGSPVSSHNVRAPDCAVSEDNHCMLSLFCNIFLFLRRTASKSVLSTRQRAVLLRVLPGISPAAAAVEEPLWNMEPFLRSRHGTLWPLRRNASRHFELQALWTPSRLWLFLCTISVRAPKCEAFYLWPTNPMKANW